MLNVLCLIIYIYTLVPFTQTLPVPVTDKSVCLHYSDHSKLHHEGNRSTGVHELPYQRPPIVCRTFLSPEVEASILRLKGKIHDADLFRLFENAFPNTLDTAILWTGFAYENDSETKYTDEDLAFVITGDMWGLTTLKLDWTWLT